MDESFVLPLLTPRGLQRDYFGAHTFRVLPGKENAKFKTGEDIRAFLAPPIIPSKLNYLSHIADVNWTGRGGNVSASTYNT